MSKENSSLRRTIQNLVVAIVSSGRRGGFVRQAPTLSRDDVPIAIDQPILAAMHGNSDAVAEVLYGRHINNEGLRAFMQSMVSGRLNRDDARRILECSPRLANALMSGLSVSGYSDVTPSRFLELAGNGSLVSGAISRALSQ